ncbi:hypothetical protein ACIRS1_37505 [Kitasatospora sp. NPDC101176]|uniref:hypothetical protein n=1 Tax=Kitasatospora sp. NPDC101176 TaxID=3364099 RepID=UPI0037F3290A
MQGLLEVLPGHPGRPAADPAADAVEQPVLLVVVLVLGEEGASRVLGEGGMQRRAGLPRLGVDDGLRHGKTRQGAVGDAFRGDARRGALRRLRHSDGAGTEARQAHQARQAPVLRRTGESDAPL